MQNKIV